MPNTVTDSFLRRSIERREKLYAEADAWTRTLPDGKLSPGDKNRYDAYLADIRQLARVIADTESEIQRQGNVTLGSGREIRAGNQLASIDFDPDELRHTHERVMAGESVRLEARDFGSVSGQLPAQLAGYVTAPIHEGRILDELPAQSIDAPSIEVIQINSVNGLAAPVGEGELKPEMTPVVTPLTITAKKLALHVGLSYEAISDFETFCSAVRNECQRRIIDLENKELIYGTGVGNNLNGFFSTPGILSLDVTTVTTQVLDAVEQAITALRVGPSLATANLLVLHPTAWSALRQTKDGFDRYLVQADPTVGTPDSIWGCRVLVTTACDIDDGLLLDTTRFGRAMVREGMIMRVGTSGDDLVRNILRTVFEERLNLAVERPSAVLRLTGMTPTVTAVKNSKSSKE